MLIKNLIKLHLNVNLLIFKIKKKIFYYILYNKKLI